MRLLRRFSTTGHPSAGIFATDLLRACADAFATFGGHEANTFLRLPITVPFDDDGRVVLGSAPPQPDAPRVPASLEIARSQDRFDLALSRVDGRPLIVPGVLDATGGQAALVRMSFAVTGAGLEIAGAGAEGQPSEIEFDETTARALANALLITIGVKLAKAHRGLCVPKPEPRPAPGVG